MNLKVLLILISRFTQSLLYIGAGINHFRNPEFYYKIIPPILSRFSFELNILSGAAEVILGILLVFTQTRKLACIGLIFLLIAVFPANIYLAIENGAPLNTAPWIAWARLPLQFILIYWAYFHFKVDNQKKY